MNILFFYSFNRKGNLAPSEKFKKIILKNLSDEFGGPQRAHERLFCDFASSLGQPNIYLDFVEEKYNVHWVREFNKVCHLLL